MHLEVERLVGLYDRGGLSRRQLLQGLLALRSVRTSPALSLGPFGSPGRQPHYFTLAR